jgi:hypothetical protein
MRSKCFYMVSGSQRRLKTSRTTWALAAHACNPSCSGGRDQEDRGSKPAQENSSMRPYLEKNHKKKGWWSGSRWRPWVQAPVLQEKKKKKSRTYIVIRKESTRKWCIKIQGPDVVVPYNPSTREIEPVGRWDQASLGCIARHCLEIKPKTQKTN